MMAERDDALASALVYNTDDPNSNRGKPWLLAIDNWIEFVDSREAGLKPKKKIRKLDDAVENTVIVCPTSQARPPNQLKYTGLSFADTIDLSYRAAFHPLIRNLQHRRVLIPTTLTSDSK